MNINRINEYDITDELQTKLQKLLIECFEDEYPKDRIYFKQLPQFRFIITDNRTDDVIAQVGLDYRMMNLNGQPITILGIIDLCVSASHRSKGIASLLLSNIDTFCKGKKIDFILLFADQPDLYVSNGFKSFQNICTWLQIDDENQTTYGIGKEKIEELMIKEVEGSLWEHGELDLLGYLY